VFVPLEASSLLSNCVKSAATGLLRIPLAFPSLLAVSAVSSGHASATEGGRKKQGGEGGQERVRVAHSPLADD
jgi:hypothetical protein